MTALDPLLSEVVEVPVAKAKSPKRKKRTAHLRFIRSCALYSLLISSFYLGAPPLLRWTNPPLTVVDTSLDIIELGLGLCGVVISVTFFKATSERHLLALGCSWLAWMLASFLLSICALHQLILELVAGRNRELVRVAVDSILTVNAPVSIYFILLFISSGRRRSKRRVRRERKRRVPVEGESASCCPCNVARYPQGLVHDEFANTVWTGEPDMEDPEDDETIVYYV